MVRQFSCCRSRFRGPPAAREPRRRRARRYWLLSIDRSLPLSSEKKADFRQSSLDAVYAGAAVALAAVVLVAYREPTEGGAVHRGVEATCMPGSYLAYLANGVAFVTAAWLLVSYVLDARGRRAPRYELASMAGARLRRRAEGAPVPTLRCPPAADDDDADYRDLALPQAPH